MKAPQSFQNNLGDAEAGSGEAGSGESAAEGSGSEAECEEVDGSGDGDDIEGLLALSGNKCKAKEGDMSGADALAAMVGGSCDTEGMDEKVNFPIFWRIFQYLHDFLISF